MYLNLAVIKDDPVYCTAALAGSFDDTICSIANGFAETSGDAEHLIKIFAGILGTDSLDMLTDLEKGGVSITISKLFNISDIMQPSDRSYLSLCEVNDFLQELTQLTKENNQKSALRQISLKCTVNDLKMVIRLIRGDLRIHAGAKHVLDALHKDAYRVFNASRSMDAIIKRIFELRKSW